MRNVAIFGTDLVAPALGLGCASLGSRISARQGARALEAAFEQGVRWYDVAPAYGAGDAEPILADFLASRRDRVLVCSKVGLVPPRHNGVVKLVYELGRPVIGLAQGLRGRFRQMASTRNVRVRLTPELIETSLDNSLHRLRTSHLDVFALHDPDPTELERDEILGTLDRLKRSGKVRYLSVAGSLDAALNATRSEVFDLFQLADDPATLPLAALKASLPHPKGFVTHSVLGVAGAKQRLVERISALPHLQRVLAEGGYPGAVAPAVTRLLMRRAFASNADGIVLASMFSGSHLIDNVAIAAEPVDPHAAAMVARLLEESAA